MGMWNGFILKLLDAKRDALGEAAVADEREELENAVINIGHPHSFRCEWLFIRTRVRFFEIIPTWELHRIHDDMENFWDSLILFRNTMKAHVDRRGDDALYSDELMNEMEDRKDAAREFLGDWIDPNGEDESLAHGHTGAHLNVYDDDEELLRIKMRNNLAHHREEMRLIYNWHQDMVFGEL